ncbi:MAG: hypothetical protein NC541_12530 [bacterium]|nr:hypothetical protein [bacterium]
MDKYEYKIRADEIKELIAMGEYSQAAEIADTIDWRRVKSVMMLCTISDLYKINRRYEDARNMLLLAYERRPGGKTICYSLCELCIKTEDFVQAVNYYKEFVQAAPKDPARYILQYKLYEAQDVGLEERIGVLEELKKRDYREKWAYELAYLYHRVGLGTRCVEECDELILWFGDGKYVVKAMELKMLHQPLTAAQQEKYDHRFDSWEASENQEQAQPENAAEQSGWYAQPAEQAEGQQEPPGEEPRPEGTVPEESRPEELDIQVKTMDVGQYNTINLQAELAAGLQEVLSQEQMQSDAITRSILAPLLNADTERIAAPETEEAAGSFVSGGETVEASEVFFGETAELDGAVGEDSEPEEEEEVILPEEPEPEEAVGSPAAVDMAATQEWPGIGAAATAQRRSEIEKAAAAAAQGRMETEKAAAQRQPETGKAAETTPGQSEAAPPEAEEQKTGAADGTAEIVMKQLQMENRAEQILTVQPPEKLARVLSQESDGQLSLVVPEKEAVEKQITGQMSIGDILNEWERMKKENEEKRREDVRQHVMEQTGNMFTEFEASVRDGLLEKLESGQTVGLQETAEGEPEEGQVNYGEDQDFFAEDEEAYEETEEYRIEKFLRETDGGEYAGEQEDYAGQEEAAGEPVNYGEDQDFFAEDEESDGEMQEYYGGDALTGGTEEYLEVREQDGTRLEPQEDMPENPDSSAEAYPAADELLPEQEEAGPTYEGGSGEAQVMEEQDGFGEAQGMEAPAPEGIGEEQDGFGEEQGMEAQDLKDTREAQDGSKEVEDTREEQDGSGEAQGMEAQDLEDTREEQDGSKEAEDTREEQDGFGEAQDLEDTREAQNGSKEAEDKKEAQDEYGEVEELEEIEEPERDAKEEVRERKPEKQAGKKTGTADKSPHDGSAEWEKVKVRELTKEEKELYAPFVQSRAGRERLVKAIDNISMAAYTGNIIITGEKGMDTIALAKNMIREVQMTDSNFSGKVAKITGQGMNARNAEETLERLKSGALIIESASGMEAETVQTLHKALQQERLGIIVVLEDTKRAMANMLSKYPHLKECFTARMDVEAMSNDMLVAYGRQYAREREYSIDELGVLALHTRIEELQTIDHAVTAPEVKEIVDEAIRHADRKTLGHFFDILFAKRYDDEDMIILTEKDFV